jgi:predicted metal-dependent peptidase
MDRMQKARAKMLIKHPFFATLMMATPSVETRDIPTAATDMAKLYYNPDFIDSLPNDELVLFVLAHEVMHIALEHGMRLQGRNPQLWNIAADFAINLVLKDSGFEVWDKCLIDDKYKGMSADAIYEQLRKDCDKAMKQGKPKPGEKGSAIGDGGGMIGDIKQPEGAGDPAAEAKLQRSGQQRVAQAASVARMAGKLNGELERLVGEILDPKVPWKDLLRDYMTRTTKDDETWTKRNRRFQGVYLPTRHSERMGEFIVIGDTSGSIGQEELDQVAAEVQSVADQVKPERIRVVWADTRVAGEQVFEDGELILMKPKGGGGTDMRVPLEHVEQYEPQVVVLITDGYTPWPDVEPPYPLIVVCTTDVDVPVGMVVRI